MQDEKTLGDGSVREVPRDPVRGFDALAGPAHRHFLLTGVAFGALLTAFRRS